MVNQNPARRISGRRLPIYLAALFCLALAAPAYAQTKVVAVPWAGLPSKPHVVYSGGSITLQAVATNAQGNPVTLTSATWDAGNGGGPVAIPFSNSRVLERTVTYTGSPGQPFTATISVVSGGITYTDTFLVQIQAKTLDVEVNMAIDKSLWYLHKNMTLSTVGTYTSGYWTSNNHVAATASATQAFEINGHRENGNPLDDPYVDNVGRGLRHLQNNMSRLTIGNQTYGNPDTNGNGYGLRTTAGSEIYVGGQIVDAFVASATPTKLAVVGPEAGKTYKSIVTDLMDAYSWGQDDFDSDRGGWVYVFNQQGGIDSSSSQWWAIGAHAADVWDTAIVPAWVRNQNQTVGIPALQNYSLSAYAPGTGNHGGCSYRGFGSDTNHNRTASCLVMMSANGMGRNDSRFAAAEAYERRSFVSVDHLHGRSANGTGVRNLYGMFALAKGMRLAKNSSGASAPIVLLGGDLDWYRADPFPTQPWNRNNGFARNIVGSQNADGSFPDEWEFGTGHLSTAVGTIILSPTLFELGPVAACTADPLIDGTAALGGITNFDGSASSHQDPSYTGGLTYAWNFQDGNTATGVSVNHTFINVGIYNVTLTVTDNGGRTNTTSCPVDVRNQNIPPNANIVFATPVCAGNVVTLDGSSSSDLDTHITSWDWDITAPINFSSVDLTGPVVSTTYATPGVYSVGLRVRDADTNGSNSDQAFATITVLAANDPSCNQPPVATNNAYTTNEDTALTGNVVTDAPADSDPDADALTLTLVGPTTANGTLVLGANGAFTYTPSANFCGSDSFQYKVNDGSVDSNTAAVTINVACVNDAPTADDDSNSTNEDTAVSGSVTGNDTAVDLDGDTLSWVQTSSPASGTLSFTNGSYTYTPNANFCGSDSFTYDITDGTATEPATVTIAVACVNDAPTADDDSNSTNEDNAVSGSVTGNDTAVDLDGDTLTWTQTSGPANGTLSFTNGSYTYTPNANYCGPDQFSYTISDGTATDAATVFLTVNCVNDAPVANDNAHTTPEDTSVSGVATSSDIDGGAPTYTLASGPSNGTLTFNANGTYTYSPNSNYNGPDSFTFTVSDGSASDTGQVNINVTPVNDVPYCAAAAPSISVIWPPNHQLVNVSVNGVTDPVENSAITITINEIWQDEPTNTQGDGNTPIDGYGIGTSTAQVRAERSGNPKVPGNGRVYTILFTGTDAENGTCTGVVKVGVPHDQGQRRVPVDDGKLFKSTPNF